MYLLVRLFGAGAMIMVVPVSKQDVVDPSRRSSDTLLNRLFSIPSVRSTSPKPSHILQNLLSVSCKSSLKKIYKITSKCERKKLDNDHSTQHLICTHCTGQPRCLVSSLKRYVRVCKK
uniref:Protein E33 n=1 Tax=Elephant endotheliotropic herpesvirus 1A TaxID=759753 RepID=A0AA96WMC9_ELHV1|nr:protein E33 [Elephantid betaherpesvirus 1]WNZ34514.1 protein E33 [Elephant endotheliotropic herpesvirus 1A]